RAPGRRANNAAHTETSLGPSPARPPTRHRCWDNAAIARGFLIHYSRGRRNNRAHGAAPVYSPRRFVTFLFIFVWSRRRPAHPPIGTTAAKPNRSRSSRTGVTLWFHVHRRHHWFLRT